MDTKHTPGPWRANLVSGYVYSDAVKGRMGGSQEVFQSRGYSHVEAIANGKIGAASLDLLGVLKSMGFGGDLADEKIGWLGPNASNRDHFKCEFCGVEHVDCTLIEHTPICPVPLARAAIAKAEGRS